MARRRNHQVDKPILDRQPVLAKVPMTKKMLMAGQSLKGGWNAKQLALLGIAWPPSKGWKQRLVGTIVYRDTYKRFIALRGTEASKRQSKGVVNHSKKDSVASQPKRQRPDTTLKVIHPVPSAKGTIFEQMICMDCETVYTTDDPHIRDRSRVLCVKCKGMLTLLHQYEEMRDELDAGLKQVLETTA